MKKTLRSKCFLLGTSLVLIVLASIIVINVTSTKQEWLQQTPDKIEVVYFGVTKEIDIKDSGEIISLLSSLKLKIRIPYIPKNGELLFMNLRFGSTKITYGFNGKEIILHENDSKPKSYLVDEKFLSKIEDQLKFDYKSELNK
jgi:hypothetical protein